MINIKIGKASVKIDVEGCVDCGTLWSSGWAEARTIDATVGKRRIALQIGRCADCERELQGVSAQADPAPSGSCRSQTDGSGDTKTVSPEVVA